MQLKIVPGSRILIITTILAFTIFACKESGITLQDADEGGVGVESEIISTKDILGQADESGNRVVYARDAAILQRMSYGITFEVHMPTPEPGAYQYPEPSENATDEQGQPEVFSLWVFVFDPDQPPFFRDIEWTGAFFGSAVMIEGPHLTLSGCITEQTEPVVGEKLINPDSKILLVVAPHGKLNPDMVPDQIHFPSGPGLDHWWLAQFDEPE